jgi:hypothetical protein
MRARKPRTLNGETRSTAKTASRRIVPPTSRTWTIAVHEAGHCLMAYLLGLGISRAVIRPADDSGNVWWRHAGRRYEQLRDEPYSRAVVEADALVALAGAAAQWLYRDGTVHTGDLAHDDHVAASILCKLEKTNAVIGHWREYLRQRALRMLSEQRNQALIARLGGLFVERQNLRGEEIYAFLQREETRVTEFLLDDPATIEDYVGLIGNDDFARPIESLGLPGEMAMCLRGARVTTIGRLLQHSAYDIVPIRGLGKDAVHQIEKVLNAADLELAKYPRSNCREVYFSPAAIYTRDAEFARRRQGNAR